ncbi:MAG TPA: hypothetical protein VI702_04980 [Nitrospiria bacterium]
MMDQLESLKGQAVELMYNGVIYRGVLFGASEEEIYLKTSTDWITLPMEGITSLKRAE